MDVVGHQSTVISTHHTTINADAKRCAIERMPDILNLTMRKGKLAKRSTTPLKWSEILKQNPIANFNQIRKVIARKQN